MILFTGNRSIIFISAAILIFLVFNVFQPAKQASAQDFNIDLGTSFYGTPSNSFGAASGQVGAWNTIVLGTTSNLSDINGTPTLVQATVTAENGSGFDPASGCSVDPSALMADYIYSLYSGWTVEISGLADGEYDIYLYAPMTNLYFTGVMLVNGVSVPSITGDTGCNMIDGVSYRSLKTTISGGSLLLSAPRGVGYIPSLAGIQLIQQPVSFLTVTNVNDSGPGSLRQAILDANSAPGLDTIHFNIPGLGPHTIQPATPLPTISDPLIIDGYSQTGASEATDTIPASLMIELDGSNTTSASGLIISGGNSTVRGLVINRFNQAAIYINTLGGNTVEGNYIGTDVTGTLGPGNDFNGIYIKNSPDNMVGGTSPAARNLISGNRHPVNNTGYGVFIYDTVDGLQATGNTVQGNHIGTDVTGLTSIPNYDGVRITGGSSNVVSRNLISGNEGFGISVSGATASNNQVIGNLIGTDYSGTVALGNNTTGIIVDVSASGTEIGGTGAGWGNLISGNAKHGIQIGGGASNSQVLGNLIGTDISGTLDLGNGADGIMIHNSPNNAVGGVSPGSRNLISGNSDDGISIIASNATGNQITGNLIGTDISGFSGLGNVRGIQIWDAPNNTISGNVIHHNTSYGVTIDSTNAINNTLTQNSISANGSGNPDRGILLKNGANQNILPPTITSVTSNQVFGTTTEPDGSTVEIFQDLGDQGNIFIGSINVSGGIFSFTGSAPPGAEDGYLTATVTGTSGNTSEFSAPVLNNFAALVESVWRIETVDDSLDDFSKSASLALDPFGNPNISYRKHTSGGYHELKYANRIGSSWHLEVVDPSVYAGNFTSTAVDSSGGRHISYDDFSNLNYAYFNGTSWQIEPVDTVGRVGSNSSIALDFSGKPHISYDDYTNNVDINLKYAYRNGSSWHVETVDSTGSVGIHTSIALDSSNQPHISYIDWDNRDLKFARFNGSSWDIETVDSDDFNWFSSIALDSSDIPHISYFHRENNELKYAYKGGSWAINTIDPSGYGTYTSLALDSSNNPHMSYDMGNALRYANYNGSSWHIETVDTEGFAGYYNSIAIDPFDNPHISYITYFNSNYAVLKYAYRSEISISESATMPTASGYVNVSISEGSFATSPEIVDPPVIPDGFTTPFGAITFTIDTSPGETVTVVLTFPENPPAGTILFKCISGSCSPISGVTISGNKAVFDVTDGGALDEDLLVNGQIVEPSVLAVPTNPEVAVDIKPGSCPNPLNIKSKGVLPVAIIGEADFNVERIDPASINLMGLAPLRWSLEDVSTPYTPITGKEDATDCTDTGPDGISDLTLKFDTRALVQNIELLLAREVEGGEAIVLRLTGNLHEKFGKTGFVGEDVVLILKK